MRVYWHPVVPHYWKFPKVALRAKRRALAKTPARLGAWPPVYRSWTKVMLVLRRSRGANEIVMLTRHALEKPHASR